MKPQISIDKLVFSNNTSISFDPSDLIIFVGPNNSGKTTTLHDIRDILKSTHQNASTICLKSLSVRLNESFDDLKSKIEEISRPHGSPGHVIIPTGQNESTVSLQELQNKLNANQPYFAISYYTHTLVNTEARLNAVSPVNSINVIDGKPSHPFHRMALSDELEQSISDYFQDAFGCGLTLLRAGSQNQLHIGKPATENPDRASSEYLKALGKLPTLHTQGDGMRAFAGVLTVALTLPVPVTLMDEPEAFLHPPQARKLGRILGSSSAQGGQSFIATHDTDFMRGALEAGGRQVKIIRLTRDTGNEVNLLDNEDIDRFSSDPSLKYSNVVSGLFHERVIICEADSDIRFYEAIADIVIDKSRDDNKDILFLHSNGKHKMPTFIQSLRNARVDVRTIVDVDVLSDKENLRSIVSAYNGEWSVYESNFNILNDAIKSGVKRPSRNEVINNMSKCLQGDKNSPIDDDQIRRMAKLLKEAKP